jgi:carboxyl-terminal processing protease
MKKKITVGFSLTILFVSLIVCFCLTMLLSTKLFESKIESVNAKEALYEKIADIDSVVREHYYTSVNQNKVLEFMSRGYLKGLGDSESTYLTQEEYTNYQDVLAGKIFGVGLSIIKSRTDSGYMKVYRVYENSPAKERGISEGDLITAINGMSTINMTDESAEKSMTGLANDNVEITYLHDGKENNTVLINRSYDTPSIQYSKEKDSGYIKIMGFQKKTASELEYALKSLKEQGIKSLVLDIRENSSQDFDSAAETADILIKEGATIYAKYNTGEQKVLYTSDKNGTDLPIVVIINGRTGYASEMFAAMLKGCAKAKVVGTKTMGKGTIQKIFRLPDGSGLKLVVAELFTVSGESYNGSGLVPDYEKVLEEDLAVHFYDLSVSEDTQIQRALEVADSIVKNTDTNYSASNSRSNSSAESGSAESKTDGESEFERQDSEEENSSN